MWQIEFHAEFAEELQVLPEDIRLKIVAGAQFLALKGPRLGRPFVDTLKGSRHTNMKELRLTVLDGEWRVAFAFDPKRRGILLVAGNKSGVARQRFYNVLIRKADTRLDEHLLELRK